MKKILLTGGGTAGHVTPNIALIPSLQKLNYEIKLDDYFVFENKLNENSSLNIQLDDDSITGSYVLIIS